MSRYASPYAEEKPAIPTAQARWSTVAIGRLVVICPYCAQAELHRGPLVNGSIRQAHCDLLAKRPREYRLDIINAAEYTAEGRLK